MCKIQKREYSIYRRVYFAMKGGWIMSEKKLRNITDVLCFLFIRIFFPLLIIDSEKFAYRFFVQFLKFKIIINKSVSSDRV